MPRRPNPIHLQRFPQTCRLSPEVLRAYRRSVNIDPVVESFTDQSHKFYDLLKSLLQIVTDIILKNNSVKESINELEIETLLNIEYVIGLNNLHKAFERERTDETAGIINKLVDLDALFSIEQYELDLLTMILGPAVMTQLERLHNCSEEVIGDFFEGTETEVETED